MKLTNCILLLLFTALSFCVSCADDSKGVDKKSASDHISASSSAVVRIYTPEVVAEYNHDPEAFTQGLVFHSGYLYESTGLNGHSSLRQVELTSGRVIKKVIIPDVYFAEGLAIFGDRLYQLTWQAHKGFVYQLETLERLGEWSYGGEGWGLASDGKHLILSDGTSLLRFINPQTFAVEKTINVTLDNQPVMKLNELEFIKGDIYANVWQSPRILQIDSVTGKVKGVVDCSNLVQRTGIISDENVLNGIAYDPANDRIFLTGKRWAKLYEVRFVKR